MFSKKDVLASFDQELMLILHIASYATPDDLSYKTWSKQRSTLELMQYMTYMWTTFLSMVIDAWFGSEQYKAVAEEASSLKLADFAVHMQKQHEFIKKTIIDMSDEDLQQEKEVFWQTQSVATWIVNSLLKFFVAYRMQLFMQLKASWHDTLATSDLRMGKKKRIEKVLNLCLYISKKTSRSEVFLTLNRYLREKINYFSIFCNSYYVRVHVIHNYEESRLVVWYFSIIIKICN